MASLQRNATSFKFYYDIVCPFAYMASTLVDSLAERTGSSVIWTPVLLGGLYEATNATQGKGGSSTDVMSPAKLKISGQDLHRQLVRRGVPYRSPYSHPQKTVNAMRMLSAISDHSTRVSVSHNLYQAYWYGQKDVSDLDTLQDAVEPFGMTASELLHADAASQNLRANTTEAAERGAFGVPGFYVKEKLYWGTDRMFFVKRSLGLDSHPERLTSPPSYGVAKLSFFFDYSSPWSFLAMERLSRVVMSVQPVHVKIEWIPILLGALFKEIGTPMIPGAVMNEAKRNYFRRDLDDWSDYAGVKLRWPDTFPLRTVLPLRVTLAADCDPNLISHLFRAAWQDNKNIGDQEVLESLLKEMPSFAGGEALLSHGQSPEIKSQLFANTKRAVEEGVCGVPSFQVNGGEIVWGQDKLNVIADQLCGWKTPFQDAAKL